MKWPAIGWLSREDWRWWPWVCKGRNGARGTLRIHWLVMWICWCW